MYISISITLASRSTAALSIRLYALVILRRYSFYTFKREVILVFAIGFLLFRILYFYNIYSIVDLTIII